MYKVYGDYGYESETLLEQFESRKEAIDWAQGYTSYDTGGFIVVEVAYFAEDGEYVTVWTITAEDDDGQPTESEEWADFDQDC